MQITAESIFTQQRELCDDLIGQLAVRPKLVRLACYALASSALYGTSMGLYHPEFPLVQAAASAIKVPLLFLLTLAICLPTLHFVGLLFGSPVRFGQSVAILLTGICQTCILLGAFAPIALFFLVSKSSYAFLMIMHVLIFAFCGMAGLVSIYRNFEYIRSTPGTEQRRLDTNHLLKQWMLLYIIVGTQMSYNLAPFVNPGGPVTIFNAIPGNFFSYIWGVLLEALSVR